jgi:hypothetical protein
MKNSVLRANQLASKSRRPVAESVPDFAVSYHGTVSLFHPLTNRAGDWLRLHCPLDDEHQYFGNALDVIRELHEPFCPVLDAGYQFAVSIGIYLRRSAESKLKEAA